MLGGTGISPLSSISMATAVLMPGKTGLITDLPPFINRFPGPGLIGFVPVFPVHLTQCQKLTFDTIIIDFCLIFKMGSFGKK